MISFQNIVKVYNGEGATLDGVSFDIEKGEFVSLVGKSGAGKTTLLRFLLREDSPTEGRVFFQGKNVESLARKELPELRRKIGTVFQDYKLLPQKTAQENVSYVMEMMGAEEEDIHRDVAEVLEIVGLVDRVDHIPAQLSGGERQRVAIARALIHRPQVIVADEPTGNLDPYHSRDIIRLLQKINELGTTVILATHNREVINRLGKRVITLENGKVIRDEERGRFII